MSWLPKFNNPNSRSQIFTALSVNTTIKEDNFYIVRHVVRIWIIVLLSRHRRCLGEKPAALWGGGDWLQRQHWHQQQRQHRSNRSSARGSETHSCRGRRCAPREGPRVRAPRSPAARTAVSAPVLLRLMRWQGLGARLSLTRALLPSRKYCLSSSGPMSKRLSHGRATNTIVQQRRIRNDESRSLQLRIPRSEKEWW